MFFKGYANIVALMTGYLHGMSSFVFDNKQKKEFDTLKLALVSGPLLAIYDPTLPLYILSDASGVSSGAVVEQQVGDNWCYIA